MILHFKTAPKIMRGPGKEWWVKNWTIVDFGDDLDRSFGASEFGEWFRKMLVWYETAQTHETHGSVKERRDAEDELRFKLISNIRNSGGKLKRRLKRQLRALLERRAKEDEVEIQSLEGWHRDMYEIEQGPKWDAKKIPKP